MELAHPKARVRVRLAARPIKAGVSRYIGWELGLPHLTAVDVYRSTEQLFSEKTLASFEGAPVTMAHPPSWQPGSEFEHEAGMRAGYVERRGIRDGDFIRVTLVIISLRALRGIAGGQRELSCGYRADYWPRSGIAPDGVPYDLVQENIRIDHVAIGLGGRGGAECGILQRVELR